MKEITSLEIERFKNGYLKDYRRLKYKLQNYNEQQQDIDSKIEIMYGVKAIRYDRVVVQGGPDPKTKERARLELIDKSKIIEEKKQKIEQKLKIIEEFCEFSDKKIAQAAFNIYCQQKDMEGNRFTFYKEGEKLYMSEKTLQRKVDKQIEDFLKVDRQDIKELW